MYGRFWSKVAISPACWEWRASTYAEGYGQFVIDGRGRRAHRVAWFLVYGCWPIGHVLHRCDNPRCVRPSHLFQGSQRDNVADMDAKGRRGTTRTLTPAQITAILADEGSIREVGARHGVSHMTVSRLRRQR